MNQGRYDKENDPDQYYTSRKPPAALYNLNGPGRNDRKEYKPRYPKQRDYRSQYGNEYRPRHPDYYSR